MAGNNITGTGNSDVINTVASSGGVTGTPANIATSDADTIDAGGGADFISSGGGNDVIIGGAGDDIINGQTDASGVGDTAVYSGAWRDYTITVGSGGAYTIQHKAGGSDGTDTITNIETLRFGGVSGTNISLADALNDAPVVAVGNTGTFSTNEEQVLTLTAAQLVSDADTSLGDIATLSIITGPAPAEGTLAVVSGNLVFTPATDFAGNATFTYRATDVHGAFVEQSVTVNVQPVNDAPVNDATLTSSTLSEEGTLLLAGLGVSDVDSDLSNITVTLTVDVGVLTASNGPGVVVANSGFNSIVLTGTAADLNAYLGATPPTFAPPVDFAGSVQLTMLTDDGGATGSPGALTDSDPVAITVTNVEDEATGGSVGVTGTAAEGGSLTAALTSATDVDGGVSSTSYRWQEWDGTDWVDIAGATTATLTIPADQSYVGKQVRSVATTTDAFGGTTEFFSATSTITNVEDEATGGVVGVTGTAEEGGSLTAALTGATDVDDGISSTSYRWQEWNGTTWVDLAGATTATLTIPGDQSYVGKEVRSVATTTDAFGGTTEFFSGSSTITNVEDEATGASVGVTGTAEEGGSLTAALTGATDLDGGVSSTSYRWQEWDGSSWVDIAGATTATLTIPGDQSYVGKQVRSVATTTDAFGGTTEFFSGSSTIANVDDEATGTLNVTGAAEEGGSLTAALTAVADEDGSTTTAYQWQRETAPGVWSDLGPAGATLTIASDQSMVGYNVRVVATTTDALTGTTTFTSAPQVIANVNDAAMITGTTVGTVVEAGGVANGTLNTPTATGDLSSTDVDGTNDLFNVVAAGTVSTDGYGTYAVTDAGVWTYTLNNTNSAVQALNVGGTLTDHITVTAADGTTQVVDILIEGTNDAAVITGTSVGTVTERGGTSNATPGTLTATGDLLASDVDDAVDAFNPVTDVASANGYGTFSVTAAGVWTYTLNDTLATVNALTSAGTLADSFTVTTPDGTTQTVNITINGANDAPTSIYSSVTTPSPFNGPAVASPFPADGGTFIQPYTDTANLALVTGPAATPVVSSGATGFHGSEGINDGYYGNASSWAPFGQATAWLKIDLGSVQSIGTVTFGRDRMGVYPDRSPGTYTISVATTDNAYANGDSSNDASEYTSVFTGTFNGDMQALQTIIAQFPATSARYVKIDFSGYTNREVAIDEVQVYAASAVGGTTFSVAENSAAGTVVGTLAGTDPDTGQSSTLVFSVSDSNFEIVGNQVRVKTGAVLNYESTQSFNLTVTATDAGVPTLTTTQVFTINLTDVNESPVATPVTLAAIAEDSGVRLITTAELLAGVTDPDLPAQTLTITSLTIASGAGGLVNNGNGTWNYTPLLNDNSGVTFNYTVSDGSLTHSSTATLDITPVNDAPVNTMPAAYTTAEDTQLVNVGVGLSVSDADAGGGPLTVTLAVNSGTLTVVTDTNVTVGGSGTSSVTVTGTAAQINTYFANSGYPYFNPAANFHGNVTLTMTTSDNGNTGGAAEQDVDTRTITVTPVSDAPSGNDTTVAELEEDAHVFSLADFGFSDANDTPPDTFTGVKIATLPVAGSLTLNSVAVTAGQTVSAADIANGLLVFTPATNASGAPYATFTFQVQDSGTNYLGPNLIVGGDFGATLPSGGTVTSAHNTTYINGVVPAGWSLNNISLVSTMIPEAVISADTTVLINIGQGGQIATSQVIPAVVGASYHLTVDIGDRVTSTAGTAQIQVFAVNSTTSATTLIGSATQTPVDSSTFGSPAPFSTVVIDTNAVPSGFDRLSVVIANVGGDTTLWVDNVSLSENIVVNQDASPNTMTINIDPESDAPTVSVTPATGVEDQGATTLSPGIPLSITVTNNDTTGTAETVSVIISGVVNGTLSAGTDNGGGSWTLTPTQLTDLRFIPTTNFDGTVPLSVTGSSVDGSAAPALSTPQNLTVTVNPVSDSPSLAVTTPDAATEGDAGIAITITPTLTDLDETLGNVTITGFPAGTTFSAGTESSGMLTIAPAALSGLTITPPTNYNGTISLSVTASSQDDGATAATTTTTLEVNVAAVNDAPALTGAAATLDAGTEDVVYNVTNAQLLQGWSDVDVGDTLSVTGLTASLSPSGSATVAPVSGGFTITLPANYNGPVTLNYSVTDSATPTAASTAATLAFTVASVADAPAGTDNAVSPFTTNEDTAVTITAANFGFTDPDDATSNAGANALAGVLITTVPAITEGTLMLGPVGSAVAVTAGQTVSIADINAGNLRFVPTLNYSGSATFTFQVQDSGTVSGPITFTETFTGGIATGWTNAVTSNAAPVGDFLGRYNSTTGAEIVHKTFDFGAANASQTVQIEFDFLEIDSWDSNQNDRFVVFLNGVGTIYGPYEGYNSAPNDGGTPISSDIFTDFPEADEIHHFTLTATTDSNGRVRLGFGAFLDGNINDESFGVDNITLTLSAPVAGANLDASPNTMTINIDPLNDAPTVFSTIADQSTAEDASFSFTLPLNTFADVDVGDTLTLTATLANGDPLPAWLSFNATTRTFSGTPDNDDVAAIAVRVTATDTGTPPLSVFDDFTLTVTNVNDAPVANDDSASGDEDMVLSGNVITGLVGAAVVPGGVDTDVDNTPAQLSVTGVTLGVTNYAPGAPIPLDFGFSFGSLGDLVIAADGTWTFTPNATADLLGPGDVNTATVTYTLSDGSSGPALTDTATLSLTISGTNDEPTITVGAAQSPDPLVEDSGVYTATGDLNITDADLNTSFFQPATINGVYGSLTINNAGTWSYTLTNALVQGLGQGDNLTDTIPVLALDNTPYNIVVNIQGVNDAVTITAEVAGTITDGPSNDFQPIPALTGTLADNITDADVGVGSVAADTHTYTLLSDSVGNYGQLSLGSDGAWTYSAIDVAVNGVPAGQTRTDVFNVQVSDGTATATTTLTVTIVGANDTPTLSAEVGDADALTLGNQALVDTAVNDTFAAVTGFLDGADRDAPSTLTYDLASGETGLNALGSLAVHNSTGAYTFTPNAAAINALQSGTHTVQFNVQVSDGIAPAVTNTLTITVEAGNDTPVITAEVATPTLADTDAADTFGPVSGTLVDNATDRDAGASLEYSLAGSGTHALGTLVVNLDGTYTFTPNATAINALQAGPHTAVFNVQVSDGIAAPQPTTLTVNITGANDRPIAVTVAPGTFAAIDEDASFSGTVGTTIPVATFASDADNTLDPSSLTFTGVTIGGVTAPGLAAAGISYSTTTGEFSFDGTVAAYQGLAVGESTSVVVAFTATDGTLDSNPGSVTFTVRGTNDGVAIIAGSTTAAGAVVEDADVTPSLVDSLSATGTITFSDADLSNTHTAGFLADGSNPPLALGTFALGAVSELGTTTDGTVGWTYTLDNVAAQALAEGETVTEKYNVTVSDVAGATATQQVTITITGTNDAPTIAAVAPATITDTVSDADTFLVPAIRGTLSGADVDHLPVLTYSVTGVGSTAIPGGTQFVHALGTLTVLTNGEYTFAPNAAAINALDETQDTTLTFTVQVADQYNATATTPLVINIDAENDSAHITGSIAGAVSEDAVPPTGQTATGLLTETDVDDASGFVASTQTTLLGTFSILASGAWTYTLNNAATATQALAQNATATEAFTVGSLGGTPVTVTITVNGTNDAPVITGIVSSSAAEGSGTATVNLLAGTTDIDTVLHIVPASVSSLPPGFTVVGDTVTVDTNNAAYDSLGVGQSQNVLITYQVTDGIASPVNQTALITITGANDAPQVGAAVTSTSTEDTGLVVINLLSGATDPDTGAVLHATTITGLPTGITQVGDTLVVDTSSGAFQSLATGVGAAVFSLSLSYGVTDGVATTTQSVNITVTGANDRPTVTAVTGAVTEDLTTFGSFVGSDVDTGDTFTYALVGAAPAGFALTGTGPGWTFDAASYDSLAQGQTLTLVIPYTATDNNSAVSNVANLTITITGTNDAPVVTALSAAATEGGATVAVNGLTGATDGGDGGSLSVVPPVNMAALNAMGVSLAGSTFTLDPTNAAFDSLAAGATTTVTVNYGVFDGVDTTANAITFTVIGTNDTAVIGGVVVGTVTEDGGAGQTFTGVLTIADLDAGQNVLTAVPALTPGDNGFGTFAVATDGTWTYTLNNGLPAVQALGASQTLTDRITVTSADGTDSQVITVTIQGSNDGATIAGAISGTVVEDTTTVVAGLLTIADVDAGEAAVVAIPAGAGTYGTFTVSANGAWTYTLTNSDTTVQALRGNQSLTDSIVVTSADGTDTETIIITINGSNDRPTVAAVTATVAEDGSTSGTLSGTDVDNGHAGNLSYAAVGSLPAGLVINTNGTWTFDASSYDSLANGATLVLVVPYTATDPSFAGNNVSLAANLTITITGTNDGPTVTALAANATEGGASVAVNGLVGATDGGDGGALIVVPGVLPTGVNEAGGVFTLDPTNAAFDSLAAGATTTVTVNYGVFDGVDTTANAITFTVIGTNDTAVIGGVVAGTVTEDGGAGQTFTGALTISDADAGQNVVVAIPAGTFGHDGFGTFSVSANGAWTYTLNNGLPAVQALGASQTLTDRITVTSADGSDTQVITVTIQGTNDGPALTGGVGAIGNGTEDVAFTVSAATLLEGYTDVDTGAVLSVSGLSADHGVVTGPVSGVFTITPTANYNGPLTLTYNIDDGAGGTVPVTRTISIAAVADADTINTGATLVADSLPGNPATSTPVGFMSFGTNNSGNNFAIATDAIDAPGLEIGLRADMRFQGSAPLQSPGSTTYVVPVGMAVGTANDNTGTPTDDNWARWNYTLSINADTDNNGGTLADYEFTFTIARTPPGGGVPVVLTSVTLEQALTNAGFTAPQIATFNAQSLYQDSIPLEPSLGALFDPTQAGTYTVTVAAADRGNGSAVLSDTIAILVNTAPVAGNDTLTTNEDMVVNGSVFGNDTDAEGFTPLSVTAVNGVGGDVGVPIALDFGTGFGTLGNLVINGNGTYTFTPTAAADQLADGDTVTATVTYTVVDGAPVLGAADPRLTDTATLTITLQGTNDGAAIAGVFTGSVTEDTSTTFTGALTISDADAGQNVVTVVPPLTAGDNGFGTFEVAADGTWTYTLNNGLPAVQALGVGQTLTDRITVTSADGTDSQVITVTIQGTNDGATIGGVITGGVTEDGDVTTGGQLTIADADAGQAAVVAIPAGAGTYGTFAVSANGAWTYTLTNSDTTVQALRGNQSLTDSIVVTSMDGSDTETIIVTISGTNDVPVVTAVSASVAEDGTLTGQTVAPGTDVDAGQAATLTYALLGSAPSGLTFNSNGTWSFDAGSYDSLASGATLTLLVPFRATDESGGVSAPANLTITITGTNDAPTVTAIGRVATEGGSNVSAPALGTATDVDTGAVLSVVNLPILPSYVTFNSGTNQFTLDPRDAFFDDMAQGATRIVTVYYGVSDGIDTTPATITFTVIGRNDAPTVSGVVTATGTEDGAVVTANALANASDVDTDPAAQILAAVPGVLPAGVTFNAGAQTFSLDPTDPVFDGLPTGVSTVITVHYAISDGMTSTPATVQFTITGTNDLPTVTALTSTATEGGASVAVNGLLGATDGGDGGTLTVVPGTLPAGVTYAAGVFTLDPTDAAYNGLAAGATMPVVVTYGISDGADTTTNTITFTVVGTNDAPVATSAVVFPVPITEGASFAGTVVAGAPSSATEIPIATFITDVDGTPLPSQLTFTGATINGLPVVNLAAAGITYIAATGVFSIATAGVPEYEALPVGGTATVVISYTSTDAAGATSNTGTVQFTVQGTNDVPTVTAGAASVVEDGVVTGTVIGLDTDAGETASLTFALTAAAPTGLTFNPDGSYSFDASSYDSLADGATLVLTVPFTATDAQGATSLPENLVITITGTNDAPVAASGVVFPLAISEGASFAGTVVAGAPSSATEIPISTFISDVDGTPLPSQLTFTRATINGTAVANLAAAGITYNAFTGTFSIATSGVPQYEALPNGGTASVVISYTSTDAFGATSNSGTVEFTVQGTNDDPVVGTPSVAAIEDSGIATLNLLAGASDVEGQTLSVMPGVLVTGMTIGGLPVPGFVPGPAAAMGFQLAGGQLLIDTNAAEIDLQDGEVAVLTFEYSVTDTQGGITPTTATFTLTGVNDTPTVTGVEIESATEGTGTVSLNLLDSISDEDHDETFTVVSTSTLPAGFTMTATGVDFDTNDAAYNGLAEGQTQVVSFTYTVEDAAGASVTQTANITITGTNDGPVASGVVTENLREDSGTQTYGNLFENVTDPDAGANLDVIVATVTAVGGANPLIADPSVFTGAQFPNALNGQYGSLLYNPSSGEYQYFTTNNLSSIQALIRNTTQTNVFDTFNFTLTDEHGVSTTHTVRFNIRGQDDNISVRNDFMTGVEDSGGLNNTSSTFTPALGDAPITPTAINVLANDFDLDAGQTSSITVTTFNLNGFGPVAAGSTVTLPNGATLSIAADGELTFDQNGAYDSLGQGDFANVVVFYAAQGLLGTSAPSTSNATLTIRIAGTNDEPVVTAMTIPVSEDGPMFSVPALLQATDVDSPTLTVVDVMPVLPAGVTYSAGEFTIDPSDAAYQSLGVGETTTVVVTYSVSDGIAAPVPTTLTFEVVGTNDVPAVVTATAMVDEDATTSGTVVGTDADVNDTLTYALVGPAPTGLTFNSDGTWDFDADSYDSLADGATLLLSVAYAANDGTVTSPAGVLEITITGTNDGPTAVGQTATAIEDGAAVSVNGLAGASDGGDGGALTVSYVSLPDGVTETGGVFTLDPSHASFQSLPAGATATVTVDFDVEDGLDSVPSSITFTVVGTNDGATIGGVAVGTLDEDTTTVSGTLTITDDDTGENTVAEVLAGTPGDNGHGTFEVLANGDWTYTLDTVAAQALGDGEILTDRITVTSFDGSDTQVVEVTITGTNDDPVVTAAVIGDITEDTGTVTVDLLDGVSDVEGQVITVSNVEIEGDPLPPFVTLAGTQLVFDTNAAALDASLGEFIPLTLTYDVTDSQGATVSVTRSFTFNGANDAPTVSAPITAPDATEGVAGLVTINALTNVVELDTSPSALGITGVQEQLVVIPPASLPDGVTFDAGIPGSVAPTFTLDPTHPSFNALTEGQTHTIVIDYEVSDGVATPVAHQAVFRVIGTNDAPTGIAIGGNASGAVTMLEHTPGIVGTLTTADADSTTFTYQIVGGAHASFFTIGGANGDEVRVATNTTLDLERDGAAPLQLIVRSTDNHGATVDRTLAISIGDMAIDNVFGTETNDIIYGGANGDFIYGLGGNDTLAGNGGADQLYGGEGADGLNGGEGNDTIGGGSGEDWVVGGGGADGINGDGGADVLYGNAGEDWINGGEGADFIDGGTEADVLFGNAGADGIFGGTGNDYIDGGEGNDTLLGQDGADGIFGGGGTDVLYGGGDNDSLVGGAELDLLYGESGNDSIDGGAGNDLIYGGIGQDFLTGGSGADTFIFEDGDSVVGSADYIMDWQNGSDFISLLGMASTAEFADLSITQSGASVVITDNVDLQIIVLNANAGDFDAADFYFNPGA